MKTTVTKTMTMSKRLLLVGFGVLFLSGESLANIYLMILITENISATFLELIMVKVEML